MSQGKQVETAPRACKILDDRLYLNYSRRVRKKWKQDIDALIPRADVQWRRLAAERP